MDITKNWLLLKKFTEKILTKAEVSDNLKIRLLDLVKDSWWQSVLSWCTTWILCLLATIQQDSWTLLDAHTKLLPSTLWESCRSSLQSSELYAHPMPSMETSPGVMLPRSNNTFGFRDYAERLLCHKSILLPLLHRLHLCSPMIRYHNWNHLQET